MKKAILFLLLITATAAASAQIQIGTVINTRSVVKANFLLVWQAKESFLVYSGDMASPAEHWVTNSEVFATLDALLEYVNTVDFDDRKTIGIQESNIVGVWDLTTAKKINLEVKREKKKREKQVLIEADEWEDSEYIIKE